MSSSRARTRLVAITAAIPLLVGAGPLLTPAVAEDGPVRQAALVLTQGSLRIGPRAGFRGDVARGIEGNTAVVAFDAASSATVNSMRVGVVRTETFAFYHDFDSIEGFALYKDLDDNDRLDPADFAAGKVSLSGYEVEIVSGSVFVTVKGDPAKATGEDSYLLTVRPATSRVLAERDVTFTVPPNGIVTTAGTIPAATLTLSTITIDSKPPAGIPVTNFQRVNRPPLATCPPGATPGTCGDDAYQVHRAVAAEPDEKLGFYNALNVLSDDALLTVPAGPSTTTPALYDVGSISDSVTNPTELSIGNGTGRDIGIPNSRALNNQISDDVFAVQWDPLGNTVTTTLTNVPPCNQNTQTTCNDFVPRGNDVTGPKPASSYTVEMLAIKASSDQAAFPVTGSVTGIDSALHTNQVQSPIAQLAYPEEVTPVPGSSPVQYTPVPNHKGAEKRSSTVTPSAGLQQLVTQVDVRHVTEGNIFPENSFVWAQTRLVDALGNTATPRTSAAVLKDTIAPSFVRISLVDTNANGVAEKDETFRVEFNDPMNTATVSASNVESALALNDPTQSPTVACGSPVVSDSKPCPKWGTGATVTWSSDRRLVAIKLGDICAAAGPGCTTLTRLPKTGDRVTAASTVDDTNGNDLTNGTNFPISAPSVLPISATTKDSDNVGVPAFGTARDGVLDAIHLKFNGALDPSTITDVSAAEQFELKWNGKTVTPTASLLSGTTDTIKLTIKDTDREVIQAAQWHTGATPVVVLKAGSKVLRTSTSPVQDIAPFSLTSIDGAAPIPISVTTTDANKNGKIDRVFVKFPEAIQFTGPDAPNPCGWTVTGYTDANYKPHGPLQTGPQACNPTRNKPNAVPAGSSPDTIALDLVEQATVFDTAVTPPVSFIATNKVPNYPPNSSPPPCTTANPTTGEIATTSSPNCPINDSAGNKLPVFSTVAVDAAAPAIVERSTADANSDGRIDRIDVKFSEEIDTLSVGNTFALSNPAYTILAVTVPTNSSIGLRLENTSTAGDTGTTPTLTHSGGIKDLVVPANLSANDSPGVAVTDKAPPAIMAACPSSPVGLNGSCQVDDAANDEITVFFSEPVAQNSVQLADFVVEQPAGTVKTPSGTLVHEDSDKRVVLPFAQGAIDSNADSFVRFGSVAPANGVQDKATVANTSVQTATITAFKVPTVSLNLTCPTPANPGYCMANTVNTGATGTAAVSLWRLSTAPRATVPPDSEFKTSVPAVYPESGVLPEGPLTLYLSGKDSLGRLTPEVSQTITILKAPRIDDLQFVHADPTSRGSNTFSKDDTLVDGDTIHIGADAYGTDADEWAENGAPTGGGCLVAHMAIDLRPITNNTADGNRAPTSCDLAPPDAEQEFREMEFPVVKATRTTRYPVGTVLKATDTEPGSIVVDGPNGTLARRQFISVGARRSWMITDASVIKVPSHLISSIPRISKNVGYRDGAVLRSSTGYYYVENGVKRPVSTYRLRVWRISTTTAYRPTASELRAMPTGKVIGGSSHQAGTWIKYSSGTIYQVVRNAAGKLVRRKLAHSAALRTLVPTSQIYPALSADSSLPVDTWLRGYRDGTILVWRNSARQIVKTGVIARGSLRLFASPQAFNTLGFNASNGLAPNGLAMPRVSGQAYRTGVAIDRYALAEVVIKVTNKAGASVTAEVPDANGLYGVGTFDPAPTGWDRTR